MTFHTHERIGLNTFRALSLLSVALLLSAGANRVSGQQHGDTGSLILKVIDSDIKLPVIGCLATLTPRNAGALIQGTSNDNGEVHFKEVSPGIYKLKVALTRYFPAIIDTLAVRTGDALSIPIELHPYNGLTEYDAYDDLAKGIVRIFYDEWLFGPGINVSSKYGFRIELRCCDTTFKFDRYNNVVYSYLDSLNGPGWYDRYFRDLWAEKVRSDSINNQRKR